MRVMAAKVCARRISCAAIRAPWLAFAVSDSVAQPQDFILARM
jgi:hypothetical protein